MKLFNSLSLKNKIVAIVFVTTLTITSLTCIVLAYFEIAEYKDNLTTRTDSLAKIASFYSKSALEFNDKKAATNGLEAFKLEKSIISVSIFNQSGKLFSELKKNNLIDTPSLESFELEKSYFSKNVYYYSDKITDKEEVLGTIIIAVDLSDLYRSISIFGLACLLIIIGSSILAYILAVNLQRIITQPILNLVKTSKIVSETNNYSIRSVKKANDEIGQLVESFNKMLERIELRESELKEQSAELEIALDHSKQASQAKSSFLATMSHEIRTPLNGILGSLHLICNFELPNRVLELANIAKESCQGLNSIISDVLDLSKIEAGKMTLEENEVSISSLTAQVIEILKIRSQEKNIVLSCIISKKVPNYIKVDETRLRQVLLNLTGNALKFTANGCVKLIISSTFVNNKHKILFEIVDTGVGIEEDKIKNLFQSFSQADSSITRKYGGTGLGLSICKEIVELMNGEIGVKSIPGEGSTFWFTLSLEEIESKQELVENPIDLSLTTTLVCVGNHYLSDCIGSQFDELEIQHKIFNNLDSLIDSCLEEEKFQRERIVILYLGIKIDAATIEKIPKYLNIVLIDPETLDYEDLFKSSFPNVLSIYSPIHQSKLFDSVVDLYASKKPEIISSKKTEIKSKVNFKSFSHARVLVADDNKINRIIATQMLNQYGIKPDLANDGIEALNLFKEKEYDLVFMDLHMPEMDGLRSTELIREIERENVSNKKITPIVALTADVTTEIIQQCKNIGMTNYLSKPMEPAKLLEMLEEYLN